MVLIVLSDVTTIFTAKSGRKINDGVTMIGPSKMCVTVDVT